MKILLIVFQVAGAAGVGFKQIINGLVNLGCDLRIITSDAEGLLLNESEICTVPGKFRLPNKLAKLTSIILKQNLEYKYWELSAFKKFNKNQAAFNPDLVFSLVARGNECSMNLGYRIAKNGKIPLAVHMVDPIPPPKHWENYERYRLSLPKTIYTSLKYCAFLSMGNQQMIAHQQKYFDFDIKNKSIVVPDPIVVDSKVYPAPLTNNIFLYLGSFYGSRKPDSLIGGFKKYAAENSNAVLRIVGNNKIDLDVYDLEASVKDRIELIGWVENVDELIAMSAVLVDVDTDMPGDVFLSSKIKKYLPIKRPVLSITSKNSPAEQLLKAFNNSAVISDHNVENVAKAMRQLINQSYNSDSYLEREVIIKEMSIENSLNKIMYKFNQLVNNKL